MNERVIGGAFWPKTLAVLISLAAVSLYIVGIASISQTGFFPVINDSNKDKVFTLREQTSEDVRVLLLLQQAKVLEDVVVCTRDKPPGATANAPSPCPSTTRMRANPQVPGVPVKFVLFVFSTIFLIVGLAVLWGSREPPAFWLGLFCACFAPALIGFYAALQPAGMRNANAAATVLEFVAYYALFRMALALATKGQSRDFWPARWWLHLIVSATLGIALVAALAESYFGVHGGWELSAQSAFVQRARELVLIAALGGAFCAAPLLVLLVGYQRQRDERQRRRLGLVLLTAGVGLLGPLAYAAYPFLFLAPIDNLVRLTVIFIPIGFAVAIPAYRVVDVAFVTRAFQGVALVGLSLVVIATVEVVAGRPLAAFLQNKFVSVDVWGIGWKDLIEVAVTFVIVLLLHSAYTGLEPGMMRVLYRKRYDALKALKRLAHIAPFQASRSSLLDRTTHDVREALGATAVAVYWRSPNDYARLRMVGTVDAARGFEDPVKLDDVAFSEMTPEVRFLKLVEVAKHADSTRSDRSGLGDFGVAFPMAVSGQLRGALVCGRRIDEEFEGPYAREELDALEAVARQLAQALLLLSARGDSEAAWSDLTPTTSRETVKLRSTWSNENEERVLDE